MKDELWSSIRAGGRLRRLSREAIWILFGQAMTVSGALVGVRLLTELLSPAAYGALALSVAAAMLINQTVMAPLGQGVARFYALALELNQLHSYLRAIRDVVLIASGIVTGLAACALIGLSYVGRSEWLPLASGAAVLAVLTGYNSILSALQNAARQRAVVAFHTAVEIWLRFMLAAVLVFSAGGRDTTGLTLNLGILSGWETHPALPMSVLNYLRACDASVLAMIGYACAALLVNASQYLFVCRLLAKTNNVTTCNAAWRSQIWKFSLPLVVLGLFSWGQQASDRWALQHFAMTEDVGRYAVLFQLGYYPISMANGMVTRLIAPIIYQRAGDARTMRRRIQVKRLTWMLTYTTLLLTALGWLLASLYHDDVFRILVAKEYRSTSALLPWIVLSSGVFAAGETRMVNIMCELRTRSLVAPKIVSALVAIGANVLGAAYYATQGVVMAGLLFSLLYFAWMTLITRR